MGKPNKYTIPWNSISAIVKQRWHPPREVVWSSWTYIVCTKHYISKGNWYFSYWTGVCVSFHTKVREFCSLAINPKTFPKEPTVNTNPSNQSQSTVVPRDTVAPCPYVYRHSGVAHSVTQQSMALHCAGIAQVAKPLQFPHPWHHWAYQKDQCVLTWGENKTPKCPNQ